MKGIRDETSQGLATAAATFPLQRLDSNRKVSLSTLYKVLNSLQPFVARNFTPLHTSTMSSAPLLSASVTRILSVTGFPPELKTRDFQAAFAEYENQNGGFKIKWVDDTSLLLVFNDAGVGQSNLAAFSIIFAR